MTVALLGKTTGPTIQQTPRRPTIELTTPTTLAPHGPLFVASYPATYPDSVLAFQVRWDYAELYDWMEFLGRPGQADGVNVTGWAIDALEGRLFFGVETPEMVPIMSRWLVAKGIPCRLVKLGVMGQARLVSQLSS